MNPCTPYCRYVAAINSECTVSAVNPGKPSKHIIRGILLISTLAIVSNSCSHKASTIQRPNSFTSFEISFTNGWAKSFSILVDSNKIYHSPQSKDMTYYGIMPDSIFKLFDTTFHKIKNDHRIKSQNVNCFDCQILAIKIISKGDTIRINQKGQLDSFLNPLINSLIKFIDSHDHNMLQTTINMETKSAISSRPTVHGKSNNYTK